MFNAEFVEYVSTNITTHIIMIITFINIIR